jgi:hypothetical protein
MIYTKLNIQKSNINRAKSIKFCGVIKSSKNYTIDQHLQFQNGECFSIYLGRQKNCFVIERLLDDYGTIAIEVHAFFARRHIFANKTPMCKIYRIYKLSGELLRDYETRQNGIKGKDDFYRRDLVIAPFLRIGNKDYYTPLKLKNNLLQIDAMLFEMDLKWG